jgi:hypothetical protein
MAVVFFMRASSAMIRTLFHRRRYLGNITMFQEVQKMITGFWIRVFYQTFLFSLIVGVKNGVKHMLLHGSLFDGGMKADLHS